MASKKGQAMPTYRIHLTKQVTDGLCATVEIKARNQDAAIEKALAAELAGKLDWEFDVADPEGGTCPEVDSVEQIGAPASVA
jgi:hypothetical protein